MVYATENGQEIWDSKGQSLPIVLIEKSTKTIMKIDLQEIRCEDAEWHVALL